MLGTDWKGVNSVGVVERTGKTRPPANRKTYRGAFRLYARNANYPKDYFFEIEDEGALHKVPVIGTNLFGGLQRGELIEIDTLIGVNVYAEIVQRVRVLKPK